MCSVGQAVYDKAPHRAVATPALVSAHQAKSEDDLQLSITAIIRRSESIFLNLALQMHFLRFPGPWMLQEKRSVLYCTFSTSQRGRADQGYTYVVLRKAPRLE